MADSNNSSLSANPTFARPRRCAQRLAINAEKASGMAVNADATTGTKGSKSHSNSILLLNPPVSAHSGTDYGITTANGNVLSPNSGLRGTALFQMKSTPRCLTKVGPKPTALHVPSSFEDQTPFEHPPPPKYTREERDAKHKLVLLLWESFRYQRKQMLSSRSSNGSTAGSSTCRSSFTSGHNTPVSFQHSPAVPAPHSPSLAVDQQQSSTLMPNPLTPPMCNNRHNTGSSHEAFDHTTSALTKPWSGMPGAPPLPLLSLAGGNDSITFTSPRSPLRVPRPCAAPKDGEDIVPLVTFTDFSLAKVDAENTAGHNSNPTGACGNADAHAIAMSIPPKFYYDDADAENQLLQQGVDRLTTQWKGMVGQLDNVWDNLEGDIEGKYHKLKLRITSMLLWERLDVTRNMLTPPLDAIRQMNSEHERRLQSLPRGSLFHNSPVLSASSMPTSPLKAILERAVLGSGGTIGQSMHADNTGGNSPTMIPT